LSAKANALILNKQHNYSTAVTVRPASNIQLRWSLHCR